VVVLVKISSKTQQYRWEVILAANAQGKPIVRNNSTGPHRLTTELLKGKMYREFDKIAKNVHTQPLKYP